MRMLRVSACGLGEELGRLGRVRRDPLASLEINSHKSTPDQRVWGKGAENQLRYASLSQFFTLAWVRSEVLAGWGTGDGLRAVSLVIRIVCRFLGKEAA